MNITAKKKWLLSSIAYFIISSMMIFLPIPLNDPFLITISTCFIFLSSGSIFVFDVPLPTIYVIIASESFVVKAITIFNLILNFIILYHCSYLKNGIRFLKFTAIFSAMSMIIFQCGLIDFLNNEMARGSLQSSYVNLLFSYLGLFLGIYLLAFLQWIVFSIKLIKANTQAEKLLSGSNN